MVSDKIKELLEELFAEEIDLSPDMYLMRDLGLDSLDIVELVLEIEDTYEIEIDEEEREKIRTVADLVNAVESRM
ncbi:MAG: acyl carrier protein [Clostridia bacterium]|nr:acyl carrier protein [Clostridia bacterium]